MPYRANYPATVAEVIDESMTFKPAALAAVRELARAKPWRGTPDEKLAKLRDCLRALAAAYEIPLPSIEFGPIDCYMPARHAIYTTRSSVVTFLHEFAHARGYDERQACRWSLNLFRRVFPRSFGACGTSDHMLIAPRRPSQISSH